MTVTARVARGSMVDLPGLRSKRAVILTAAIDRFGHEGYEQTKWATIACDVGISEPTLYYYFESKAHCLLAIMRLGLGRSLERTREAVGATDGGNTLESAITAAYDLGPQEVLQMRILQNHLDLLGTCRLSRSEEAERRLARHLLREIDDAWTECLRRGMESGEYPARDPRIMATVVLAMVVSVWRWYRPGGPMALDEVRDLVLAACRRVVGP